MIEALDESSDQPPPKARSGSPVDAGAIAVWLLIQLTVLALAAARVPLWYRAPSPVERAALEQMLVAQVVVPALLFPWLMRSRSTAACVLLVSAPFVPLASMLSQTDLSLAARAWVYVVLWIAALGAWAATLRTLRAQLIGVAVSAGLAIGGPVLRYLRFEFSRAAPQSNDPFRWLDPASGVLSQLWAEEQRLLVVPLMVGLGALIAVIWRRAQAAHDKLSTAVIHRSVERPNR